MLRFCRLSIENRRGELFYADADLVHRFQSTDDSEYGSLELGAIHENEMIALTPMPSSRSVAAIDTSTIRLGELEDGVLCALRGAAVILERNQYKFMRYGPLLFSLGNPLNVDEIAGLGISVFTSPNVDLLLRRVRSSLERWLQLSVCRSLSNALVLLDGSLIAVPESSGEMRNILAIARRSNNLVIAISKNTQLRLHGKPITVLLKQKEEPCLLNVDEQIRNQFASSPIEFLGRVFVGKLATFAFPFRLDIDRGASVEDSVDGLEQLTGTDIVDQGYPETLRLAHILSTFTAGDVLAIQSLAQMRFGVQLMPKVALRRSLFGPFGTGWESGR